MNVFNVMRPFSRSALALLWVLSLLTAATGPISAFAAEDEHAHDEENPRTVSLTPEEQREFGVEIAVAGPAEIVQTLQLPGEVQVNGNRLAHISPRFPGIVTKVGANIGDKVTHGQALAVIQSDQSLSNYEIKTMISGTIIDKHLTLGEAITREATAFVVADLSTVWVDITVFQKDLPRIKVGQQAVINGGHGMPVATGTISYLSPVIDEATRTALARVVLPNPQGGWRPGSFINADVMVAAFPVEVAVPRTALQGMEEQDVVFLKTPAGFVPSPVTIGRKGRDLVEITAGLEPGQEYVSRAGFTLKAELGKDSFGEGHAH